MTNGKKDIERLKPPTALPNLLYIILLILVLLFHLKLGSRYSFLYSIGVCFGISLPALILVIIYNSLKGEARLIKVISSSVTIFLLVVVLIAQLAMVTTSKGELHGEITTILPLPPLIERHQIIKQTTIGPVRNREIVLLKYSNDLITSHQQLVDDCSDSYRQINAENERKYDDIDRRSGSFEYKMRLVINAIENFDDLVKQQSTRCADRRNTLIVSHIVMKSISSESGTFQFWDVPYGRYLLSAQWGLTYWFVPVEIKQPVSKLNLSADNAFDMSQQQ